MSGIYPLSLALASEFDLHLTDEQIWTIMITMMVSEAIMVAPTGYLMQHIYLRVFFIALFIFNLVLVINSRYVISLMEREVKNDESGMNKQIGSLENDD